MRARLRGIRVIGEIRKYKFAGEEGRQIDREIIGNTDSSREVTPTTMNHAARRLPAKTSPRKIGGGGGKCEFCKYGGLGWFGARLNVIAGLFDENQTRECGATRADIAGRMFERPQRK